MEDDLRTSMDDAAIEWAKDAYLRDVPATVPDDRIVVHNSVRPASVLGDRGFRAWLLDADAADLGGPVECDCGWAPHLSAHYRMPAPS